MSEKKQTAATSLFKDVKTTGISNIPKVKCCFCGTVVTKNSYRMKKHIESCRECAEKIKLKYLDKKYPGGKASPGKTRASAKIRRGVSSAPMNQSETLCSPVTGFPSLSRSVHPTTQLHSQDVQSVTMSQVDKMTEAENAQMALLLAKAILASAAPLKLVENRYWKKFFSSLRPTFQPPNHQKLSNILLDQVYEETRTNVRETVATVSSVALLSDGWKNTTNEAVINFHVTVPEPVFWNNVFTSSSDHTAAFVADQIQKVVEDVGSQKVFGLCTDYATNMKEAWGLIKQKYPHIQPYGCLVHGLNLIFSDVCKVKSLSEMIADCEVIARSVNNCSELFALFKQHQQQFIKNQQQTEGCSTNKTSQQTLRQPVNTWWGSSVQSMENLFASKRPLQALASSNDCKDKLDITVTKTLLSEIFWSKISVYLSLLKPVVDVIRRVEGEQHSLSIVMKVFHDIESNFHEKIQQNLILQSDDKNQIKNIIANGKSIAVKGIHLTANLLDPNYTGCHLTDKETIDAFQVIQEIASKMPDVREGQIFGELADYRSKQKIFQKSFIWSAAKHTSPHSWWAGLCRSTELSKIAVRILELPPTCTASVKSCNKFARVYSSMRKGTTSSKADRLSFVGRNLCLTESACTVDVVENLGKGKASIGTQTAATTVAQQASTSGTWTPLVNIEMEKELADISPIECDSDDDSESDL